MSSSLIIAIDEDSTACIYEEELKDFGLDSITVDTLDKAISILEYQQFDLILLLPDSSDKQKVNDLLGRMRLLKSTYRNTKILVISLFYSIRPGSFEFADALVARGTGPEWLLVVCELLGIDKQRVWDRVESGMKLLGGRVKVRRKDIKLFLCYAKEDFKQAHLIYQRLNNEAYSP